MTLETLLDCDASKLEAMTDAQLLEHFAPYLNVTRPELARAITNSSPRSVKNYAEQKELPIYNDKQKAALALLAAEGVDTSFMKQRFKRR